MTLITLFTKEPFLNEPGIRETHKQYNDYHQIIEFKNIEHSVLRYIDFEHIPENFEIFFPIVSEYFNKNKDKILKLCEDNI